MAPGLLLKITFQLHKHYNYLQTILKDGLFPILQNCQAGKLRLSDQWI